MSQSTSECDQLGVTPLYSSLGMDPDLGEIVELFVNEMPNRIEGLLANYRNADREGLGRIAHQLKGALGSYGFDELTPYAVALESNVRGESTEDEIESSLNELVAMCQRLRSGGPE